LKFEDGNFPNIEIIKNFLNILNDVFNQKENNDNNKERCIAIHCIAGLGRFFI